MDTTIDTAVITDEQSETPNFNLAAELAKDLTHSAAATAGVVVGAFAFGAAVVVAGKVKAKLVARKTPTEIVHDITDLPKTN